MSINLERLKTMSQADLLKLAREVNAPHHHKNSAATLIENIINHVMNPPNQPTQEVKPMDKKEAVFKTEEEVLEAIKPFAEKIHVKFDHETQSVTFINKQFKSHAETISLSAKIKGAKSITSIAGVIARGPIMLRGMKGFDKWTEQGGNNAYTNVVL